MAHILGVLDTWESERLIDEILAEAAKDGVSQNQWLTRQQRGDKVGELDGLRQAVDERCGWCGDLPRKSCWKLKLQ